jgi:hypothetical protein
LNVHNFSFGLQFFCSCAAQRLSSAHKERIPRPTAELPPEHIDFQVKYGLSGPAAQTGRMILSCHFSRVKSIAGGNTLFISKTQFQNHKTVIKMGMTNWKAEAFWQSRAGFKPRRV